MPLQEGSSKETISQNVSELIKAFKKKGKIGNVTPENMGKARKVALAAAFSSARKDKKS